MPGPAFSQELMLADGQRHLLVSLYRGNGPTVASPGSHFILARRFRLPPDVPPASRLRVAIERFDQTGLRLTLSIPGHDFAAILDDHDGFGVLREPLPEPAGAADPARERWPELLGSLVLACMAFLSRHGSELPEAYRATLEQRIAEAATSLALRQDDAARMLQLLLADFQRSDASSNEVREGLRTHLEAFEQIRLRWSYEQAYASERLLGEIADQTRLDRGPAEESAASEPVVTGLAPADRVMAEQIMARRRVERDLARYPLDEDELPGPPVPA
jgi:hypothetical protein